jgi:hypothetical protein
MPAVKYGGRRKHAKTERKRWQKHRLKKGKGRSRKAQKHKSRKAKKQGK